MVWRANRMTGEFGAVSRQCPSGRATSALRQLRGRLMAWWMQRILATVEDAVAVAVAMFRVRNFTAPPTRLQDARFHVRVAPANLRRRYTDHLRGQGSTDGKATMVAVLGFNAHLVQCANRCGARVQSAVGLTGSPVGT
jgi:hypothetical protein